MLIVCGFYNVGMTDVQRRNDESYLNAYGFGVLGIVAMAVAQFYLTMEVQSMSQAAWGLLFK